MEWLPTFIILSPSKDTSTGNLPKIESFGNPLAISAGETKSLPATISI